MNLEEAKEVLNYLIDRFKNIDELKYDAKAMEVVLNALDEREMLYIKLLAKGINESISYNKKNEEELELLNDGWKIREKELLNIIKLMAEKINQAYFEENDFYTWFEEEFGILPNGYYEEKIINHFMKLTKEDK